MINRVDDEIAVEVDSEAETKAVAVVASWYLEGYLTFYLESKTWLQVASLGLRLNRDGQANEK